MKENEVEVKKKKKKVEEEKEKKRIHEVKSKRGPSRDKITTFLPHAARPRTHEPPEASLLTSPPLSDAASTGRVFVELASRPSLIDRCRPSRLVLNPLTRHPTPSFAS
ncbi:hypothetical protein E2C01_068266 [Portunus trituberculatus]|uniref:Uncharacterized protein n=1 Tax=Portunus trituberculatus TaxID=210409 RepID=A0A5B7HVB9_PORTR|nr:hypothetical protein [Portunus trituberculatus]